MLASPVVNRLNPQTHTHALCFKFYATFADIIQITDCDPAVKQPLYRPGVAQRVPRS